MRKKRVTKWPRATRITAFIHESITSPLPGSKQCVSREVLPEGSLVIRWMDGTTTTWSPEALADYKQLQAGDSAVYLGDEYKDGSIIVRRRATSQDLRE